MPGELEVSQIPQMITLTFNGAINVDNIDVYQRVFSEDLINPNGCSIKATIWNTSPSPGAGKKIMRGRSLVTMTSG